MVKTLKKIINVVIGAVVVIIAIIFWYYNKKPNVTVPVPVGVCTIIPYGTVTIYSRPGVDADVFGTLSTIDTQTISGITTNGWYAFEPGVAQAGNSGIFRNRYIPPVGAFSTTGNCTNLTALPTLPVNVCFTMAPNEVKIYKSPDIKSKIVETLPVNGYIQVISMRKNDKTVYANHFIQVKDGYVLNSDINLNGHCDNL